MNDSQSVFLKGMVQAEPLINNWYAWPLLIAPVTAAMVTKNLHLRIIESFLKSPKMHANAAKTRSLKGGMFLNFEGQVERVQALADFIKSDLSHRLQLADDIAALDELLRQEANGEGLQGLYCRIPEGLKGFVELGYDLNNNPSFRVIESLMYRSEYYDDSLQSLSLSLLSGDDRPFVLSTPRFESDNNVIVSIPYSDERIDWFFESKKKARPLGQFKEVLGLNGSTDKDNFYSLFTTDPPASSEGRNYDGRDVRIRYLNHATILVESSDTSILIDPIVSYDYEGGIERFSFKDLPDRIDYVVMTHNHQDHVMFETLLQLRHKVNHFVVPKNSAGALQDPSLRLVLENTGFKNIIELDEMQSLLIPGGEILGLPFLGEHSDLHIRSKLGYCFSLKGRKILCLADSNNLDSTLYRRIHQAVGDIDTVFIGMECDGAPMSWLYGPLLTKPVSRKMDQSRRLDGSDCKRALGIVSCFNPKQVYVYAMGAEPWLSFITSIDYTKDSKPIVESDKFVVACQEKGIVAERLYGKKEMILS